MTAARRKPWEHDRRGSGKTRVECVTIAPVNLEPRPRAGFVIYPHHARRIRCVHVCVAGVGALVSLEAVQAPHCGIQHPVVVLILLCIPLVVAVPVFVDQRFFLTLCESGPKYRVNLRVQLILHRRCAIQCGKAAHLQRAVELNIPGNSDSVGPI